MRHVEARERLHQSEAGRLIIAEHVARHRTPVDQVDPDSLRFGDEISDGEHQSVADKHAVASALGAERAGNGVLIRNGLVLTIGYLITEAQTVWINLIDGRPVPGH